jgi:hypothetical protein
MAIHPLSQSPTSQQLEALRKQMDKELKNSILGGANYLPDRWLSTPPQPRFDPYFNIAQAAQQERPINRFDPQHLHKMLVSRMGWDLQVCPFKVLHTHKLNDQTAVVFVIHQGKALVIEDDLNLYPSDALVTQLRLLGDK